MSDSPTLNPQAAWPFPKKDKDRLAGAVAAAATPVAAEVVTAHSYRKRPVVIEAFKMTRARRLDNSEWPNWLNEAWQRSHDEPGALYPKDYPRSNGEDELCILTLEGTHLVKFDDWIIRGVKGDLYPCKPEIFEATYEPA